MIRHIELFAGVGGFRQALESIGRDCSADQMTVAYSETDKHALRTYKAAYDTEGETEAGDIEALCADSARLSALPACDLLTGGFPCQSFSMMGRKQGFSDSRGSLFFRAADVLRAAKPEVFVLENVRNLLSHDGGSTLRRILDCLSGCGYTVYYDLFNSQDFGLAQTRRRVFIAGFRCPPRNFVFTRDAVKAMYDHTASRSSLRAQRTAHDVLEKHAGSKYYVSDRMKPTILAGGSGKFIAKSTINNLIAKPLTATMSKMHRACQDNYYSDGFIASEDPQRYVQTEYTTEELCSQPIRRLTPREAFMLQGFSDDFICRALLSGVSDTQLYRQAGNAVSVNTAYAVLTYVLHAAGMLTAFSTSRTPAKPQELFSGTRPASPPRHPPM